MQVIKWGKSLAIRLPEELVDQLGLKPGDDIKIVAAESKTPTAAAENSSVEPKG